METRPRHVEKYLTSNGRCPFDEWLDGLKDKKIQAIVSVRLNRVAQGNFGLCRKLEVGIWELKVDFGPGFRVYFAEDGDTVQGHQKGPRVLGGFSEGVRQMPKRTRDYEKDLIEKLKETEFAVEYLNASLEDSDKGSDERFLMALRHVASAHGMATVAEDAGMARQAMYRALSEHGNPELASLKAILDAIGLKLAVEPKAKAS